MLSEYEAGMITRKLLEFDSFNAQRALVNDLVASGITLEKFQEFAKIATDAQLPIPLPLRTDIYNALSHVSKGIETNDSKLHKYSGIFISKASKKAMDAFKTLNTQDRI